MTYHADAVHFDGLTELGLTNQGAGLAADAPTGLFAVWLKGDNIFNLVGPPVTQAPGILATDLNAQDEFCYFGSGATIGNNFADIFFFDSSGTNSFGMGDGSQLPLPSSWNLLLVSYDTNHPAGQKILQIYFGDAVQTVDLVDFSNAFSIGYSDSQWQLLGSALPGTGAAIIADVADFQMWCGGSFVDLSVTANRRLFIDGNGKPVDPSVAAMTLGQQTVLFSGDATSFATNQGSGGATSVLTGALADASTSPSGAGGDAPPAEFSVMTSASQTSLIPPPQLVPKKSKRRLSADRWSSPSNAAHGFAGRIFR